MIHMTHNYQLGLLILVFAFLIFYMPMLYVFMAVRKQQRKQNK